MIAPLKLLENNIALPLLAKENPTVIKGTDFNLLTLPILPTPHHLHTNPIAGMGGIGHKGH
jgi:hypothetical protein